MLDHPKVLWSGERERRDDEQVIECSVVTYHFLTPEEVEQEHVIAIHTSIFSSGSCFYLLVSWKSLAECTRKRESTTHTQL